MSDRSEVMTDIHSPGTSRCRSMLWWYRRLRRAYSLHGVTIRNRRQTWDDARIARKGMPADKQRSLPPIRGPKG